MDERASAEVTQLLRAWGRGDRAAFDELVPLVAAELHDLAHRYMRREHPGHTLQTTALVNEAYLRLIGANHVRWQDRAHFFAIAANLMRRVLVDHARSHGSRKRGGGMLRVTLDEGQLPSPQPGTDVVALDEALDALAAFDPRAARIVELRFFGGLTLEDAAAVVGVSARTAGREWAAARAWLLGQMTR